MGHFCLCRPLAKYVPSRGAAFWGHIIPPLLEDSDFLEKLEFLAKSAYFNNIFRVPLTDELIAQGFAVVIVVIIESFCSRANTLSERRG